MFKRALNFWLKFAWFIVIKLQTTLIKVFGPFCMFWLYEGNLTYLSLYNQSWCLYSLYLLVWLLTRCGFPYFFLPLCCQSWNVTSDRNPENHTTPLQICNRNYPNECFRTCVTLPQFHTRKNGFFSFHTLHTPFNFGTGSSNLDWLHCHRQQRDRLGFWTKVLHDLAPQQETWRRNPWGGTDNGIPSSFKGIIPAWWCLFPLPGRKRCRLRRVCPSLNRDGSVAGRDTPVGTANRGYPSGTR